MQTRSRSATCSICLSPGAYLRTDGCDTRGLHLFCHECISQWQAEHSTCPVCKAEFGALVNPRGQALRPSRRGTKRPRDREEDEAYEGRPSISLSDFERQLVGLVLRHLANTSGRRILLYRSTPRVHHI